MTWHFKLRIHHRPVNTWKTYTGENSRERSEAHKKIVLLVTLEIYGNLILKMNLFSWRRDWKKINKQTDKLK